MKKMKPEEVMRWGRRSKEAEKEEETPEKG